MFITIINDCNDQNALGRQATRVSAQFNSCVNTVGINNDIEAAGNLIDMLDAVGDEEGYILVNVAPRSSNWNFSIDQNGNGKHWENGTPFASFKYKNITVISTIDGYTLSLVKKLNLVSSINLYDIPTVTQFLNNKGLIDIGLKNHIDKTQFRSFDFSPRVAYYLEQNIDLPSTSLDVQKIKDIPNVVWWIDNFGNCKTSLLQNDLTDINEEISTRFGKIRFYERLKDVPDNSVALITGSSGIEDSRFIELVVQGHSADKKLGVKLGDEILM